MCDQRYPKSKELNITKKIIQFHKKLDTWTRQLIIAAI